MADEFGSDRPNASNESIIAAVEQWSGVDHHAESILSADGSEGDRASLCRLFEIYVARRLLNGRVREFHEIAVEASWRGIELSSGWMFDLDLGTNVGDKVSAFRTIPWAALIPGMLEEISEDCAGSLESLKKEALNELRGFAVAILEAIARCEKEP